MMSDILQPNSSTAMDVLISARSCLSYVGEKIVKLRTKGGFTENILLLSSEKVQR